MSLYDDIRALYQATGDFVPSDEWIDKARHRQSLEDFLGSVLDTLTAQEEGPQADPRLVEKLSKPQTAQEAIAMGLMTPDGKWIDSKE